MPNSTFQSNKINYLGGGEGGVIFKMTANLYLFSLIILDFVNV